MMLYDFFGSKTVSYVSLIQKMRDVFLVVFRDSPVRYPITAPMANPRPASG